MRNPEIQIPPDISPPSASTVFCVRDVLKQRGCYIRLDCGWYVCVLRLGAAGVHGLAAGLKLVRNVVVS